MQKLRTCIVSACLLAGMTVSAPAQEAAVLETELVAEVRVSDKEGASRFVPATVLAQGDVVHYTVRIRNASSIPAHTVVVTQRIPANTRYVIGSATGPAAEIFLSNDGGQTFVAEREVEPQPSSAGASAESAYTHVRWRLRYPLAAGAVALARFDAVFQ